MRIGYIGFSIVMLRELIEKKCFYLECCICEKTRITEQLREICRANRINLLCVTNKESVKNAISHLEIDKYVMYEFGTIIPKEVVSKKNIVNFHPGSLENNRGKSPIVQSILQGDRYSKMVVYRVDEKIDQGDEISSQIVEVEKDETSKTLKCKLEENISVLLDKVYEYWTSGMRNPCAGLYLASIKKADFIIDTNVDSPETASKKIRSQALYIGGILEGNQVDHMENAPYHWEKVYETDEVIEYIVTTRVKVDKKC